MADLVVARSAKGPKTEFRIDRRLVEKYPDDYVVVAPKKAKPEAKTAE